MHPTARTLLRVAAWALIALLALVTLSPIGARPTLGPANVERAAAYAALGLILALAYPRHRLAVLAALVAVAAGLELGQALTLSRHGRLADFLVKAGGGSVGWLAACALLARGRRPGEDG